MKAAYNWIEPVTDRTAEDVAYANRMRALSWQEMTAAQQEEYQKGLKGTQNRRDFERLENDIQALYGLLGLDGAAYDGTVPAFLTEDYFTALKERITTVRERFGAYADIPQVPPLPYDTWEKYNALEKILKDVYETVNAQFHYYAGTEIYTGEITGLLL